MSSEAEFNAMQQDVSPELFSKCETDVETDNPLKSTSSTLTS